MPKILFISMPLLRISRTERVLDLIGINVVPTFETRVGAGYCDEITPAD